MEMETETETQWGDRRDLPLTVSTLEAKSFWAQNRLLAGLAAARLWGPKVGQQGPGTVRKPQGEAAGWGAGTVGTPSEALIPPLSLQVTQLQQVYSDRRQRLHRTVAPAVPVCGKEWGTGNQKGGGSPAWVG